MCVCVNTPCLFSQNIYFFEPFGGNADFNVLKVYDAENCQLMPVFDFEQHGISDLISFKSLSFHPDGRLYMIAGDQIIAFNIRKRQIDRIHPILLKDPLPYLAISENGRILITDDPDTNTENDFLYLDYDLRNNRIIRTSTAMEIFGIPDFSLGIGGFLPQNDLLLFGETNTSVEQYPASEPRFYGYWDRSAGRFDTIQFHHDIDYFLFSPSVYWPPCESLQFLATSSYNGLRNHDLIHLYTSDRMISPICSGLLYPQTTFPNPAMSLNGVANTTDFRQSSLRIDLDGDNSSGHITAGYYDTLTTCRNEAPVVNNDVELYICENPGSSNQVDSISFRLIYYDQPLLAEERIYSDDFENELHPTTSLSRWVWKNPGNRDLDQIKEFLRSLRYRAGWDPGDPDQSRERAVAVTIHVGNDSTSSWTVYQLEPDEVYAGRDTVVEYCSTSPSLELTNYLSEEALPGGRFDPTLSAGEGIFIPGTDSDGPYMYIVESGGCADTAIIELQDVLSADPGLDTVYLCSGGRKRIGFEPGKFTDIHWWDGSDGDSIWIQETTEVRRQVQVAYGDCGFNVTVEILLLDSENLVGPDTTITFCQSGGSIDLNNLLNHLAGSSVSILPALQSGGLMFTPGTDEAGMYELIIRTDDGCADTARITFQETASQELEMEDITLCAEEDMQIGLPANGYQNVIWWNGHTGDSTVLTGSETGPFWVEAVQNGCMYRAEFEVTINDAVQFPGSFTDTVHVCPRDPVEIRVENLDSIVFLGATYHTGNPIFLSQPGKYTLKGFLDGCSVSQDITVVQPIDQTAQYDQTIYWCEGSPLTITLPTDSAGMAFNWSDGTTTRNRNISAAGEYDIEAHNTGCIYQSTINVIQNDEGECQREECMVSIPNAITVNGDGYNDFLEIFRTPSCGAIESVTLWNKWGGLLYETNSTIIESAIWQDLPVGIYIVRVEYRDHADIRHIKTGSVLLIR